MMEYPSSIVEEHVKQVWQDATMKEYLSIVVEAHAK
jgi:hypothetical protein